MTANKIIKEGIMRGLRLVREYVFLLAGMIVASWFVIGRISMDTLDISETTLVGLGITAVFTYSARSAALYLKNKILKAYRKKQSNKD